MPTPVDIVKAGNDLFLMFRPIVLATSIRMVILIVEALPTPSAKPWMSKFLQNVGSSNEEKVLANSGDESAS